MQAVRSTASVEYLGREEGGKKGCCKPAAYLGKTRRMRHLDKSFLVLPCYVIHDYERYTNQTPMISGEAIPQAINKRLESTQSSSII